MHFSNRILTLEAKDIKKEIIVKTAFILAKVIDKGVAKTKASFLTLS